MRSLRTPDTCERSRYGRSRLQSVRYGHSNVATRKNETRWGHAHLLSGYRPFELCDGANWRRFTGREEYQAWRSHHKAPNRDPLSE